MNMNLWSNFLNWCSSVYDRLPIRLSFFVALLIGALLVWFAITSDHPLAAKWVGTLRFEYGNRFMCLVMLYFSHRIINSELRSHDLLDAVNHNKSSPVYVAWCATWVFSCALIIAFVS